MVAGRLSQIRKKPVPSSPKRSHLRQAPRGVLSQAGSVAGRSTVPHGRGESYTLSESVEANMVEKAGMRAELVSCPSFLLAAAISAAVGVSLEDTASFG